MRLRVNEVMRHDVVTVRATATLDELNKILSNHQITGTPVVDGDGKVVGVVSQSDLVKRLSKNATSAAGFYEMPPRTGGRLGRWGRSCRG